AHGLDRGGFPNWGISRTTLCQPIAKLVSTYTEHPCSARYVAIAHRERSIDERVLDGLERQAFLGHVDVDRIVLGRAPGRLRLRSAAQHEVTWRDHRIVLEKHDLLETVTELAHVARPVIARDQILDVVGKRALRQ